ncbi:MAG: phosphoglycerate mutase family protein [Bdellovibrionales bacterium]|nr:phosphoglycerate mutase family protein [Bdellovibrionales bacterium]
MHWLYLFRHGETDYNREHRFQGHLDIPLNDEGKRQAAKLVPALQHVGIDCILSSDLMRARETAEIAALQLGVPVFETRGLREAHLGGAQGLTTEQIAQRFGQELVEKWRSPDASDADVSYPGGESGREVLHRALHSIEEFIKSSPYTRIGIATHGGVIRRIVRSLLQDREIFIPIPNGILYPLKRNPSDGNLELVQTMPLPFNR